MCVKGKISDRLSEYIATLSLNNKYSDITFCVENERFPAHRLILASSEYFEVLLFGHFAESQQNEIKLPPQVQATPFKALLTYIYSDCILLDDMKFSEIIGILRLAHMYDFTELTATILNHLEQEMSLQTVCQALNISQELSLDAFRETCMKFLDGNASTFLLHETFAALSQVKKGQHQQNICKGIFKPLHFFYCAIRNLCVRYYIETLLMRLRYKYLRLFKNGQRRTVLMLLLISIR